MSVDLLALFKGQTQSSKPGAARTDVASTAHRPAETTGPKAPSITLGAYVIKVTAPAPSYTYSQSGSTARNLSGLSGTWVPGDLTFYNPDSTGNFYFESTSPSRHPNIPALFHLWTGVYTDGKTTSDVALNERLYRALIRETK